MLKNHRILKSALICGLILISFLVTVITINSKAAPVYNARVVLDINWSQNETQVPIIPRDEIKKVNITIIFKIETGETFGEGLYQGYIGQGYGVIDLEIVETPSWCSAALEILTVIVPLTRKEVTTSAIYMNLNEDAPAYGSEGFIKIKAKARPLGLIEGFEQTYTLNFVPAYIPIIKTNLPEVNTKRIDPSKNAIFPIEIENAGNARTKVFFKVENIPKNWEATITDDIILNEPKGSKNTAYLTIVPPKTFGYHYDEANIRVIMIPVRAENPEEDIGTPLHATFTVQNRGFSTNGIEQIFLIGIIVFLISIIIIFILRVIGKRKKTVS